ncbi:MAG: COG4315 family predicted lipoprotein [Solirubrobacteraceae bacterium]
MIIGLVVGLLAPAGCGGSDTEEGAAAGGAETVDVREIEGVGSVLVDASGSVLYTAEQEADGRIRCVDGCLALWLPLTAPPDGPPVAGDGVAGALSVVERDDGTRQVTYDGAPVYRFSEDGPGEATGDGLEDSFDGQRFTWRAITIGAAAETDAPSGGYGY